LADLERHLQRLAARGELRRATVVFGVTTDPFHPFDEKFPTSMKFLEMFERYGPGRLVIQTRSPLVTIGIPVLKKLQRNTFVAIGIETPLDDVRRLYTPSLPSVEERFKTVRALKRFGLQVGVQVAPILPYGDWRKDAGAFAEKLSEVADFINIRSLAQAGDAGSGRGESTPLAKKLAAARQFFWLRRDTHVPLTGAVEVICPEKLFNPVLHGVVDPQLRLFAQQ
jgi:DNA repair photolyase